MSPKLELHDQDDPVEPRFLGHIAETGRALVVVEPGSLALGGLAGDGCESRWRASP